MSVFNPNWIKGKKVDRIEMNAFWALFGVPNDRNYKVYSPTIYFTDGSHLSFIGAETETCETGVDVVYQKAQKKQ
jgi:hypothetical protein